MNQAFPVRMWETLFSQERITTWQQKTLLKKVLHDKWQFDYRIIPYDTLLLLTSRFDRTDPQFTFLSFDSLYLATFIKKRLQKLADTYETGLDLGCGTGIQSFSISPYCKKVLGLDINPHAIPLARMNASLNGISHCTFEQGDIATTNNGTFDIVVSNPPFIFYPANDGNALDSNGGAPFGLGITAALLKALPKLLKKEGRAFIMTRAPIINKRDYLLDQIPAWVSHEYAYQYHHISDSITPMQPFETALGITGYRNIILELYRGNNHQIIRYPWWHRQTNIF
ncbi:MAG TPA: methyltransferase domain-containing protein [Candidatus Omnitrophota bacterium]|nr:methyltransferase domain-containing protein [Candidatus Omnitrophota bacterium]